MARWVTPGTRWWNTSVFITRSHFRRLRAQNDHPFAECPCTSAADGAPSAWTFIRRWTRSITISAWPTGDAIPGFCGAAACRYLQLDEVNLAYLCDEEQRAGLRERGDDPESPSLPPFTPRHDQLPPRSVDRASGHDDCGCTYAAGTSVRAGLRRAGIEPVAEMLFITKLQ